MRDPKIIACPVCRGSGFIMHMFQNDESSGASARMCEASQGHGVQTVPLTNADRIRLMGDEELAKGLYQAYQAAADRDEDISRLWCDMRGGCVGEDGGDLECNPEMHLNCILRWLGAPVKEELNG